MGLQYFDKVIALLELVEKEETPKILEASKVLTDAVLEHRSIYAFGASHAGILTQELFYRAGGLMVINPIFPSEVMLNVEPITQTSKLERLEGYGTAVGEGIDFKEGDVLIIHSVSGRNAIAIDLAMYAREKGVYVIAITNVSYSSQTTSRHSSKKRLFELANLVLDNHGDVGDATCVIEGMDQKVGPTSTVVGASILNAIVSETVQNLVNSGMSQPPIFYSANIDGGDEKNLKLISEYKDVIKYKY